MGDDLDTGDDAAGDQHAVNDFESDEAKFREAFVNGANLDDEQPPEKKQAGKAKAAAADDGADRDDEDDADQDDEDEIDLDEPDEPDEDERAAAGESKDDKDPELAKRLAQVKRNEQRSRETLARERAAFERDREALIAEWKPRIEAAQEFERLRARAASDPAGVLMALGLTEDDFEDASKILYGLSKAGATDPKNKAAAHALRRERELRQRLDASEARFAELEKKLASRDEEAEGSRRVDEYIGRVERAASDDTPLLKKSLETRPAATRAKLSELAYRLAQANGGDAVSPREVARAFEKRRRAALERDLPLGELLKPKGKGGSIRVEDRSGGGGNARASGSTNGHSAAERYLSDAEILKNLREGNLD